MSKIKTKIEFGEKEILALIAEKYNVSTAWRGAEILAETLK